MTTVVSILLSDVIPLRNRGTWQGYVNLIYAAGASAGAPLGGVLADSIGWRWYAHATLCCFCWSDS
jgi:MFS family permease